MRIRALLVSLLLLSNAVGCKPAPTVLVVGLDGGDWDVIDPLIEGGFLPTIGHYVDNGARADFDCTPAWPAFSCFCPPVWVSIATGQPAGVHGIISLGQRSTERRVKAIWEVYSETGGVSVLSSYRNTDPPEDINGFIFTEVSNSVAGRVNYRVWGFPDVPEEPLLVTKPEGLYEKLGMLPYTEERRDAHPNFAKDRVAMEGFSRLTGLQQRFAGAFGRPGLHMIILHAIDKFEHLAWGSIQPTPQHPVDPERVKDLAARWAGPIYGPRPFALGNAVSQYLEADLWLGELLETVHFDYVVFVSDHGMTRSAAPGGLQGLHGTEQPEAHVGIFSITGPGVVPGTVLEGVDLLDVVPTLAYILDIPVADDLPGRVLEEAFSKKWLKRHRMKTVPSWELPDWNRGPGSKVGPPAR